MRIRYDLNAGALYIALASGKVARTEEAGDNAAVDLDASGAVVGIEVISIGHRWPLGEILRDYDITPSDSAKLRAYFSLMTVTMGMAPSLATLNQSAATLPPVLSIERPGPVPAGAAC